MRRSAPVSPAFRSLAFLPSLTTARRCDIPVAAKEGEPDAYTAALIRHLPTAGLELPWLMEQVRNSVLRGSKGTQEPVQFGPLPDAKMFVPAAVAGEK